MINAKIALLQKKIFVAGERGMVGSAVVRALRRHGAHNLLMAAREELDLCNQSQVERFFDSQRPDVVIFAAGKVGGIHANRSFPADFLRDNVAMAVHSIDAAHRFGVERFLYLGSTCIYPRDSQQPIGESSLLTGPLEATNEAYALAKIAGLKMCQFYRQQFGVNFHSAMPTNLYGPGDNYHAEHSHVLPALLHRFHAAKLEAATQVEIWGSGTPRREFLHVDDLADAIWNLLALDAPPDWVNVGTGEDISIRELAELIAEVVGFQGEIVHDLTKPDGTPVKRTDTSLMTSLGWTAKIPLRDGVRETYRSYISECDAATIRR